MNHRFTVDLATFRAAAFDYSAQLGCINQKGWIGAVHFLILFLNSCFCFFLAPGVEFN